ncbi:uncharacterized protein LOC129000580 [Macrosteles quadrilineatus]|uniref:uncharacterized protein LOC129000580 n=1 Tax=Macrosteles quadrilineatus TaxID=74068 RepID=UPI0023E2D695|nr:uncharacterized protein LOC129000580 [Macrosteles quadrilineatus]
MQLVVVFAVACAVAVFGVKGQDVCGPPQPGEKHAHPPECCKLEGALPEPMKAAAMKCQDKFPHPPHPPRPASPPTGPPPTPSPEMKKHHACMAECVFTETGMVSGGKIDKAAVTKNFGSGSVPGNLQPVVTAAIDKCFASYEKDIDTSLECKSGAAELEKCVMREVFLNCPSASWTESPECSALKTKITSCPQLPIMMMGKGPRGPQG